MVLNQLAAAAEQGLFLETERFHGTELVGTDRGFGQAERIFDFVRELGVTIRVAIPEGLGDSAAKSGLLCIGGLGDEADARRGLGALQILAEFINENVAQALVARFGKGNFDVEVEAEAGTDEAVQFGLALLLGDAAVTGGSSEPGGKQGGAIRGGGEDDFEDGNGAVFRAALFQQRDEIGVGEAGAVYDFVNVAVGEEGFEHLADEALELWSKDLAGLFDFHQGGFLQVAFGAGQVNEQRGRFGGGKVWLDDKLKAVEGTGVAGKDNFGSAKVYLGDGGQTGWV